MTLLKKLRGGGLIGLGYMLSPLSWWNDLFFNLPIALAFGYAVSWVYADGFLAATVVGYWLSNVLGIVMMQFGALDVVLTDKPRNLKRDVLLGFGGATLYTLVVAGLIYFHVLAVPDFLREL